MISKLSEEKSKTAQISKEKRMRVTPDKGHGYHLYDILQEAALMWFSDLHVTIKFRYVKFKNQL
jgi:hypothetical protein